VATVVDSTLSTSTTAAPTATVDDQLSGFSKRIIQVGDEWWRVAVAASQEERSRGLMGVTDLGGVDGMLFVFPAETTSGFWMKDTLIPLEIAFFGTNGALRTVLEMEPCLEDPLQADRDNPYPCPVYSSGTSYLWALEAPPGRLSELPDGAVLEIP